MASCGDNFTNKEILLKAYFTEHLHTRRLLIKIDENESHDFPKFNKRKLCKSYDFTKSRINQHLLPEKKSASIT